MMRAWIATAMLAGSWLVGLGYYDSAHPFAWACMVAAAVILLGNVPVCWPGRRTCTASILILLPTVWLMPLPHKTIGLLLLGGLLLHALPAARRWPRQWGRGAVVASAILLGNREQLSRDRRQLLDRKPERRLARADGAGGRWR